MTKRVMPNSAGDKELRAVPLGGTSLPDVAESNLRQRFSFRGNSCPRRWRLTTQAPLVAVDTVMSETIWILIIQHFPNISWSMCIYS
jgi:hypothetical protein